MGGARNDVELMTKVKICGLTSVKDAFFAADKGADFLGFIFYKKSPRYISVEEAANIIFKLPGSVKTVGVFVNQSVEDINKAVEELGLSYVQLHGDENPEFAKKMSVPVIKSFRLKDRNNLADIKEYNVFAYLFDSYLKGLYGGTGKTFELSIIEKNSFDKPLFLSGGLTPENVAKAIEKVKPYAVDVASGVENEPGKKDHLKIMRFINEVRDRGQF